MEPGTPQPKLKHGPAEYPLTWTMRSEAIISRHGFDLAELFDAFSRRKRAFYALCVGLLAALPQELAPEDPEEIAEWLPTDQAQLDAMKSLVAIIKHARPELFKKAAEKKSASTR